MASLLQRLLPRAEARDIVSINDYVAAINAYGYNPGVESTIKSQVESMETSFAGYAVGGLRGNSVVYTCIAARSSVFSSVRFRYQRLRDGKPSDLFGHPSLRLLESPATGETTQDMLSRMIQDADLAGNAYAVADTPLTRLGGDDTTKNVLRLRPDWVDIVVTKRMRPITDAQGRVLGYAQLGFERVGYVYTEGGKHSGNDSVPLMLDEVAHFAPKPDPLASFRGMSWLTPVAREIENDTLMNTHKRRFFENGATPNMIIKHPVGADRQKVLDFQKRLQAENAGSDNAYKTLNLYPGADATVVGSNMEQLDFKAVQGAGESRIASAAEVPPIIVGLSEGLDSATYSNYAQARRRFADGTIHPLWQNAAGSLAVIMPNLGADTRLWYDADDIPFLREDEKDAAEITQVRANTLASLLAAGFTPESAAKFLQTPDDFRVLEHTGLFSVQLQAPGGSEKESKQDTLARTIQQLYLGVGTVITVDEARLILNQLGAGLPVPAPDELVPDEPTDDVPDRAALTAMLERASNLPVAFNVTMPGTSVNLPALPAPVVNVDARQEPPVVNVTTPDQPTPEVNVTVDPTPVTVENRVEAAQAPDVTVNVEAPDVRVDAPAVSVNVDPTPVRVDNTVNVEPTPVTIETPEVNVTVEPAEVRAPDVNVSVEAAPTPDVNVTVEPAEVTVVPTPVRRTRTDTAIHRNTDGEMTGSTAITEED